MPKVSVIVPIYNVEKYIERCLRSLFEQTLDDIEYIFVNDCTPDDSMAILYRVLKEYPHRSSQVKIITHEYNQGQAGARASGMKAMTGEYMIHCDPDDWVDVNMYEKLYNIAINEKSDIVWCDFKIINECASISKQNSGTNMLDILRNLLLSRPFIGSLWNRLIKREIIFSDKIVSPKTKYCEDLVLVFQYTLLSRKNSYLGLPLYYYRQHNESTTNSTDNIFELLQRTNETKINFNIIENIILNNSTLYKELKQELIWHKYIKKEKFLPFINSINDCNFWKRTYADINLSIFFNPYISFRSKFISFLILIKIYPILKHLVKSK